MLRTREEVGNAAKDLLRGRVALTRARKIEIDLKETADARRLRKIKRADSASSTV